MIAPSPDEDSENVPFIEDDHQAPSGKQRKNAQETDNNAAIPRDQKLNTALWFVVLVTASFTMSVGNKAIMVKYKFANTLLMLQV